MSTKDRASNGAQDAKGRVNEAAGSITGNCDLENEGKTDQAKALLTNAREDLKDAWHKVKGRRHPVTDVRQRFVVGGITRGAQLLRGARAHRGEQAPRHVAGNSTGYVSGPARNAPVDRPAASKEHSRRLRSAPDGSSTGLGRDRRPVGHGRPLGSAG